MFHERPDPNTCPRCGAENAIDELDEPIRWQRVTLDYDADGLLIPADYPQMWTVGDDGVNQRYECHSCTWVWPSLSALAYEQRFAKALEDHRSFWETRADRLETLATHPYRLDTVDGNEKISDAIAREQAFAQAIDIWRGNGEA